jgi:hypothetical protein
MQQLIVGRKRVALDFIQRLDLTAFLLARMQDPMHSRRLRMKYESFVRLVNLIREPLQVDELHADRRGGAITPEACVYATLRYLAGATYVCICDLLGIGRSSFYATLDKTLIAIINCEALQLQFPSTVEQCVTLASGCRCLFADTPNRLQCRNARDQ